MLEPLRVGIVGCGRIGFLLEDDPLRGHPCTHAGAFSAVPETAIVAACDIDDGRLREIGRRYGVGRLTTSYKQMLRSERLDLLSISSWTSTHVAIGVEACRNGVRGILCEKPIATDILSGRRLVEECHARGVTLIVNHERRFATRYRQVRDLIRNGAIGDLRMIVGNVLCPKWPVASWKASPDLAGGGPLIHDGTHLIDMMRFLAGDIDWVSADARFDTGAEGVETCAAALLRFRDGAMGFLEAGGDRRYFNFELDIQGSSGRIRIGNGILDYELSGTSRRYTGFEDLLPAELPPEPPGEQNGYVGAVRELVECVRSGRASISSGRDGLAALDVINAIYLSASRRGARVSLPMTRPACGFRRLARIRARRAREAMGHESDPKRSADLPGSLE